MCEAKAALGVDAEIAKNCKRRNSLMTDFEVVEATKCCEYFGEEIDYDANILEAENQPE
jgi:hypothetical protein